MTRETVGDEVRSGDLTVTNINVGDLIASGGVFLGGTAAANELDDYEEGTFTPTYSTTGTNFSSVTYDPSTTGYYTKVGRLVHISGTIMSDSLTVGSASGVVVISGLPFTSATLAGSGDYTSITIGPSSSFAGDVPSLSIIQPNNTYMILYYRTAANGNNLSLVPADMGTGGNANNIYFSGTYMAAA